MSRFFILIATISVVSLNLKLSNDHKKDIRALTKDQLRDFSFNKVIRHFVAIKCTNGCGLNRLISLKT